VRKYLLDLYEIQKIDLEIRNFRQSLDAIPSTLRQLESKVAEIQGKISSLREQSSGALSEAQTMQNAVEEEGRKIRKWESRLNDIRNQREFQALNRETEGSRRANRDTEERIHEILKNKDQFEEDLKTLEGLLETAQSQCREEKATVDEKSQAMEKTLAVHKARRDVLVPGIPKALFRKYDAIAAKRFGLGLAQVVAGCCQGCNMKLPPQLYNILQRGDTIEQCPSCYRLVFWEPHRPAEASDATQETSLPASASV
jgi:predicted  nucleic acid-binding Zn-ribbon protein